MDNREIVNNLENIQALLSVNSVSQPMAMMHAVMVETLGMSMHNAVNTQHHAQQMNNAATTSTCARILATVPTPKPKTPGTAGHSNND